MKGKKKISKLAEIIIYVLFVLYTAIVVGLIMGNRYALKYQNR